MTDRPWPIRIASSYRDEPERGSRLFFVAPRDDRPDSLARRFPRMECDTVGRRVSMHAADGTDLGAQRRNSEPAAHAPRVLVIGLDPHRVPGPWDPAPVADAIAEGIARFADAGIGVERCMLGLDGSDDIHAVVTEALVSRPWSVVVVGGGLRDADGQLHLFEQIVNLVHRHAPGAAIAFNDTPRDTFDAAARWLHRFR